MARKDDGTVMVEYRGYAGTFNVDGEEFRPGTRRRISDDQFRRVSASHPGAFVQIADSVDEVQPEPVATEPNPAAPVPGGEARSADPASAVA